MLIRILCIILLKRKTHKTKQIYAVKRRIYLNKLNAVCTEKNIRQFMKILDFIMLFDSVHSVKKNSQNKTPLA